MRHRRPLQHGVITSLMKISKWNNSHHHKRITLIKFNSTLASGPMKIPTGSKLGPMQPWLHPVDNPNLLKYITSQNKKSSDFLRPLQPLQQTLYHEMRSRISQIESASSSIPEVFGDYEYYVKSNAGDNYPTYYRRHIMSSQEQVILNPNVLSASHSYLMLGTLKVCPFNQDYIAYTLDTSGDERYSVTIAHLPSSTSYTLDRNVISIEWGTSKSNPVLFYTSENEQEGFNRPSRVYSHNVVLSHESNDDTLIFKESNDSCYVDLSLTKDQQYICISSNSKSDSEVHVIPSEYYYSNATLPRCIRPRQRNVSYFIDHLQSGFIIVTNLMSGPDGNYGVMKESNDGTWQEYIAASDCTKIEDVDVFNNTIVLYERKDNVPRLRVIREGEGEEETEFIVPVGSHGGVTVSPGMNKEFRNLTDVRFSVSTPFVPEILYSLDTTTKTLKTLRTTFVENFSQEDFLCREVKVPPAVENGSDVSVPMTLVHSKAIQKDSAAAPTLVYGYGAYGVNNDATFSIERLSLLERGWVLAFPHVRGGGEYGNAWYNAGKGVHKESSIRDFKSCIQYLINEEKITNPSTLALHGTSAGGILVANVINTLPELVAACVLNSPFVNVLETMLDRELPLTIHEYDEWGDPRKKAIRKVIESYDPSQNVNTKAELPALFVSGSLNDQRVHYQGLLRWWLAISKKRNHSPKLLRFSLTDTHFGGGGKLDQLSDSSFEYAFLYSVLRIS